MGSVFMLNFKGMRRMKAINQILLLMKLMKRDTPFALNKHGKMTKVVFILPLIPILVSFLIDIIGDSLW